MFVSVNDAWLGLWLHSNELLPVMSGNVLKLSVFLLLLLLLLFRIRWITFFPFESMSNSNWHLPSASLKCRTFCPCSCSQFDSALNHTSSCRSIESECYCHCSDNYHFPLLSSTSRLTSFRGTFFATHAHTCRLHVSVCVCVFSFSPCAS